ncbi:regulatory protein DeoR [Desulfofarcimen acetoxidans DSM 771]|uniref:Regulatory protein DeoR n=1 Tax=Desulfofarcimen acetoxidans (strain ATCC 49208 / DSM 771 / KCTC 5769 / VKM B-1644 / 5575) TaxID=485916 RepID=C8W578_DESAS|nr:transcription factor FapR [Desulfofarcimen acetoxidans]ACV62060.1 regulatory protein DeoR [Desulfofarcimen acetoxidans DSM 771]
MVKAVLKKSERQQVLEKYLANNPFLTDEKLAQILGVSIQTVRLDRGELNIPELRQRLKEIARGNDRELRSLSSDELVGELIEMEADQYASSHLSISEDMAFQKTKIARGHHLFAQANSLAVAAIDAEVVLTGTARVSFKRPVYIGELVVARAVVKRKKGQKYLVRVISQVFDEIVLEGDFLVFVMSKEVWPVDENSC